MVLPLPEIIQLAVDFLVFNVAAAVLAQRCSADWTLQTAQVPVQVVDLRDENTRSHTQDWCSHAPGVSSESLQEN